MPESNVKPYTSLQDWMERTGHTQKQLARLARLSESQMSRILTRSTRCSLEKALRLSHITGVPVEILVEWKGLKRHARFERPLKRNGRFTPETSCV